MIAELVPAWTADAIHFRTEKEIKRSASTSALAACSCPHVLNSPRTVGFTNLANLVDFTEVPVDFAEIFPLCPTHSPIVQIPK